jgi:O-antigen/teichoic acid export membrane protein
LLKYGATVTADRVLSFLYQQTDKIVVGRFLGETLLGTYNIAQTLGMIPLEKVLPIITQVSFASYARIQNDMERVRRNLLRSTRAVALVAFPLFFGMAAVAAHGIPLLLGAKWESAVLPFQLLCLTMPLRALAPLIGSTLHGIGRPELSLRNMASLTVGMTIAFLICARYGLLAVCLAWVIAYPAVLLFTITRSLREMELPLHQYLAELRFPVLASTVMLGAVFGAQQLVQFPSHALSLAAMVTLGVVLYAGLFWSLKREEFAEMRLLLQR